MVPARVFGFVAAEADVCVLLRRGPSKRVLMVRWNLATDEFEIGQWLKARVYEARCDLSHDGRLFVLQALNAEASPAKRGQYSVVCRPPYFTALAYWAQTTNSPSFRWTRSSGKLLPRKAPPPTRGILPGGLTLFEDHDGLTATGRAWEVQSSGRPAVLVREAKVGRLRWRVSWSNWPGAYVLNEQPLTADWADADRRGRLLLARAGRIFVRDTDGERELIDLNPLEFRPLAPPRWATEWPM